MKERERKHQSVRYIAYVVLEHRVDRPRSGRANVLSSQVDVNVTFADTPHVPDRAPGEQVKSMRSVAKKTIDEITINTHTNYRRRRKQTLRFVRQ